jgi:hypothetical protein
MAYKEVKGMGIREIFRRWQSIQTISEISRGMGMGIDRKTVRKYLAGFKIRGITRESIFEKPYSWKN